MTTLSDLRYLLRSTGRSPGPAVAVWLCTAVWMAVAPAFLSLLGALEWKSLPFPRADRILQVNAGFDLIPLLRSTGRFQALANYETGWVLAEGPRGKGSVPGAMVGEELFEALGTKALAGRVFTRGGAPPRTPARRWSRRA